jgi:demethoxyubiquinone hydroxylase (CLK1/Coq7/Cat5 family)
MSNDGGLDYQETLEEGNLHQGIIYEESNMFIEKMGQIQEETDQHDEEIYRIMRTDQAGEMQAQEDEINAGKLIFPE